MSGPQRPVSAASPAPLRPVVLALALLSSGCFGYVAREPEAVPDGEEVRISLTRGGTARLTETYGWDRSFLMGDLARVTDDSVSVSVRVSAPAPGSVFSQTRQVVTVARSEIEEVAQPELNRGRTALIGAGAAVVAGIILARMLEVESGTGNDPGPPGDSPSVLPSFILFSISR